MKLNKLKRIYNEFNKFPFCVDLQFKKSIGNVLL